MIEGVASGTVSQDQFRDWTHQRLVEPGEDDEGQAEADREAYLEHPEEPDDFWDKAQAQAWGD